MKKTLLALLVATAAASANATISVTTENGISFNADGQVKFAYIKQSYKELTVEAKDKVKTSVANHTFFGPSDYVGNNTLGFGASRTFAGDTTVSGYLGLQLRKSGNTFLDRAFIKFDSKTFGTLALGRISNDLGNTYKFVKGEGLVLNSEIFGFNAKDDLLVKDYGQNPVSFTYASPVINGFKAFAGYTKLHSDLSESNTKHKAYAYGIGYNTNLTYDLAYQAVADKKVLITTNGYTTLDSYAITETNLKLEQQLSSVQYRTTAYLSIDQGFKQLRTNNDYQLVNKTSLGLTHSLAQVPVKFYGNFTRNIDKNISNGTKLVATNKSLTLGTSYTFNDNVVVYLEGGKETIKTTNTVVDKNNKVTLNPVTNPKQSGKALAIGVNLSF